MYKKLSALFLLPLVVLSFLVIGLFSFPWLMIAAISIGLIKISLDSIEHVKNGEYSLDYIAFLAMLVALVTGEYLAGALVALMFTGGEALETFATQKAQSTLAKLSDSIPKTCSVLGGNNKIELVPVQKVKEGSIILVKSMELLPLDGILYSPESAVLNTSHLTGEFAPVSVSKGSLLKSGVVNTGDLIQIKVVGTFESSTYRKITKLVEDAQKHPSRTVRISAKANIALTLFTFLIASLVWFVTADATRLLAVLVVATPCPLIIAAPVAFISGMSRVARSGIIVRKPAAFEDIVAAKQVFFDKTGTLTLGEPVFSSMKLAKVKIQIEDALHIAAALELHSLHPLAKSIVAEATRTGLELKPATDVKETIGEGIAGVVDGKHYSIGSSNSRTSGISLTLKETVTGKEVLHLTFNDKLKVGSKNVIQSIINLGLDVAVITGDSTDNAQKVFEDIPIALYADKDPAQKYDIISDAQKNGGRVIMVGDGLNDAPALAQADVGIVFSGTENGASIQAADVAILGSNIDSLKQLFYSAHKTIQIAKQSIFGGVGLSILAMLFAAMGLLTPVAGAIIQEVIDVVVILNALRALTD